MRQRRLFRAVSILILAGTVVSFGFGQDCRVSMFIHVLDKHGKPVNVTSNQVKAQIGGAEATVNSFSPAAKPALIIMLDGSGSMRSAWKESIAAARELLSKAGEDVAIFVFNEKIQDRAAGHANSEKLLERWSSQAPRQGTILHDALIEVARQGGPGNAAIVVISDGDDNASTHSREETISLFLHSSWPPVFGVVVDYVHGGAEHRENDLKKISVATGGFVLYPPSASEVPEATEKLENAVFNAFKVTLQPSYPISAGDKLKLEVQNFRAFYPAQVAGCDAATDVPTRPR